MPQTDYAIQRQNQFKRERQKFEQVKNLDSMVFVEIPRKELETNEYRFWMIQDVETKWMEFVELIKNKK